MNIDTFPLSKKYRTGECESIKQTTLFMKIKEFTCKISWIEETKYLTVRPVYKLPFNAFLPGVLETYHAHIGRVETREEGDETLCPPRSPEDDARVDSGIEMVCKYLN